MSVKREHEDVPFGHLADLDDEVEIIEVKSNKSNKKKVQIAKEMKMHPVKPRV